LQQVEKFNRGVAETISDWSGQKQPIGCAGGGSATFSSAPVVVSSIRPLWPAILDLTLLYAHNGVFIFAVE
jgi:hypothetical protein